MLFDLLEKAMQEEFLPAIFGEAIDDGDYRLELAHLPVKYYGLALPNTVNSATPSHQASNDVCSHLISALKDATNFETTKYTQTMAATKSAIRTSKACLHEQELKGMTDSIPATTERTILRSQVTGKWMETPPSYDTSMDLASLMHGIFDIVVRTLPNLLTHCEGLRSSILHRSWP